MPKLAPRQTKLGELLQPVIDLANSASEQILSIYKRDFTVERKHDDSPVTEADMAAHDTIVAGLTELTPDLPILSEESAKIPYTERKHWQCYWLVDPLDGTREFIKHNGDFTINIALIENHVSVLGVIFVPITGDCYYASKGDGAYKLTGQAKPQAIQCREKPGKEIVVAVSRSHSNQALHDFLQKLTNYELRRMGSSLKSCMVAEGQVDIYPCLGPTSEWDTAAAQCIVEQAGGQLTDVSMQPLRYNTKDSLINPHFFASGTREGKWLQHL